MKFALVLGCVFSLSVLRSFAADDSITVTLEGTLKEPDEKSPAAISAARDAGAAQATVDVAAGKLEIIEYGEPVPPGIRRDPDTGLPIRSIDNCTPTPAFEAYVAAYNQVVREAYAKRKK